MIKRLVRIANTVYHSYNGKINWNEVKNTYNLSELEVACIVNIIRDWNK